VGEAVFGTGFLGGTYCSTSDVLGLLAGCDISALGDSAAVESRIEELLPQTKAALDALAGRDFELHQDETVLLDGSGHDTLFLRQHGYAPVLSVGAVAVNGVALQEDDWALYPGEGYIRLTGHNGGNVFTGRSGAVFPLGVQNVAVTLTWGYANAPASVRLAQAKLTAIELLAEASPAVSGGATRVTLGDYTVHYDSDSPFAGVIRRWEADVRAWAAAHGVRIIAA